MKLNHNKLTHLLREYNYDLPGGTKIEGLPDFTRYYIQEAAKAFMGIQHSDFDNGGTSEKNILKKVIPILAEYDLLDDVDIFYEVFINSTKLRTLPDSVLEDNHSYKQAFEHINTANVLINKVIDTYNRERVDNKKLYDLSEKYNISIEDLKSISKDL